MKMDCYHRFLKSDTYKKCAQLEAAGGMNAKLLNGKTLNGEKGSAKEPKGSNSKASGNRKSYVSSTWMETFNKIRKNGKFSSTFSLSKSDSKNSDSQPSSEANTPKPSFSLEQTLKTTSSSTSSSAATAPTMASMPTTSGSGSGGSTSTTAGHVKQRYQAFSISKIKNTFKIRSKSLDEPFGGHPTIKQVVEVQGGSIDKQMTNQQSLNLGDSRVSLANNSADSTDNVFSPSPDPQQQQQQQLNNEGGNNSPEQCHCAAMMAAATAAAATTTTHSGTGSPASMTGVVGCSGAAVAAGGSTSQSETDSPTNRHLFHNSFDHNCGREDCHFIRMTFPEYHAQTVVPPLAGETLNHLVLRTIDRKAFKYIAFDVHITGSDKVCYSLELFRTLNNVFSLLLSFIKLV